MYTLEQTDYGIKMVFFEGVDLDEINKWKAEVKALIAKQKEGFGVLVDVRKMKIMNPAVVDVVIEIQAYANDYNVGRNANIVENGLAKLQQTRVAKESGIYNIMRYIDGSAEGDPEKSALDWIKQGIDPDKE